MLQTANGINIFYTDYTNSTEKPSVAYNGLELLVETGDPNDKRKILAYKNNTNGTTATQIIYDTNTISQTFNGANGQRIGDAQTEPTSEDLKQLSISNLNT